MRWLAMLCLVALPACASTGGRNSSTSPNSGNTSNATPPASTTSTPKSTAAKSTATAKSSTAKKAPAKSTAAKSSSSSAAAKTTVVKKEPEKSAPAEPATPKSETGEASYYASKHHGLKTASGEPYDEAKLTAAHRTLPFGTKVKVTNLDNGRSVVFRVNDRGPFIKGRIVDVSRRGAFELGFIQQGTCRVRLDILGSQSAAVTD
jgi:rare lipoprotein A